MDKQMLREGFEKIKEIPWLNSQEEPDIEYVEHLESLICEAAELLRKSIKDNGCCIDCKLFNATTDFENITFLEKLYNKQISKIMKEEK